MMYQFIPPSAENKNEMEALLDRAFGPHRQEKTSYRFRDGIEPIADLSMIALHGQRLVGTISYWPICIGNASAPALLLGPLAVEPTLRGRGIGVTLIRRTLTMARRQGHNIVVLVGDADYYQRFGFTPASDHRIQMQGQPSQLMVRELAPGALDDVHGYVQPWRSVRCPVRAA